MRDRIDNAKLCDGAVEVVVTTTSTEIQPRLIGGTAMLQ